jgi:hypothetical protein
MLLYSVAKALEKQRGIRNQSDYMTGQVLYLLQSIRADRSRRDLYLKFVTSRITSAFFFIFPHSSSYIEIQNGFIVF